jgi:uncharacterized protein (DUF2336 family)
MTDRPDITSADIELLARDSSPGSRADMAAKLARSFAVPDAFTPAQRELSAGIFRLMVRDAELMVRKALAENLKGNPDLPHDIALALAKDVDEVAAPILELSSVLTEDDLETIIRSGAVSKQVSIAQRGGLTENLSRIIAEEADATAVRVLFRNEKAAIPDDAYGTALARFEADEAIHGAMVSRSRLPVSIAERLVTLVSASLREQLMERHELSADLASDLLMQARERATVELSLAADREGVSGLVRRLHKHNRLTQTLIMRAICAGDFDFFECAMAERAGLPVLNVYRLIHETKDGLARLVRDCGFSADFFEVARVAYKVSGELVLDGLPGDRQRLAERMIERILTHFGDRFEKNSVDYLIGRLAHNSSNAAVPL